MAKLAIEGCITAIITPFAHGAVDFDAIDRLVNWQIESGVDGIVAVGTTGESATLNVDEHVAVIRAVVKAARGRIPVIAGAGGNATAEALALTKASEEAGAQALLQVTPYYNKPTQEGLFRHYEAIATSTKLPIILYNVPGRTSCDLLPDTIVRLAAFENIVAVKEATGSVVRGTEILAKLGSRMTLLSGDDATAFPLYAVGARGVISVVSNIAPAEMSRMWDAVAAGNWDEARRLHFALHELNQLLFVESNPIPVKAAAALLGKCSSDMRLPLVPCTAELVERLRGGLRRLGVLAGA